MLSHIPCGLLPVTMLEPQADGAGRTSNYVSMKGAHRGFLVCYLDQGAANTVAWTLAQASVVAGTDTKACAATRIWTNIDMAALPIFAAQADGVTFTTGAAIAFKCIVFEIGREALDIPGGFDCIAITTGASAAANITSAMLFIDQGYKGETAAINPLID